MFARRLVQPLPLGCRAYSQFSHKAGGGRFFNSAKQPKVPTPKPSGVTNTPNAAGSRSATAGEASASAPEQSDMASSQTSTGTPPSPSPQSPPLSPQSTPLSLSPHPHPHPALPTLHLHSFFSLDRPLLLLNNPVSSLFQRMEPPTTSAAATPAPSGTLFSENGAAEEADSDADADTARILARAMVVQRVQSSMEWCKVLERLGIPSDVPPTVSAATDFHVEMDSVKRKRRKKITKHK